MTVALVTSLLERWMIVLADATVRGSAVILVALAIAWVVRRRPADVRSVLWTVAGCATLILPALSATVPRWRIAAPRVLAESRSALTPRLISRDRSDGLVPARPPAASDERFDGASVTPADREPNAPPAPSAPLLFLFLVWVAGALVAVGQLLVALRRLARIERGARSIPHEVVLARAPASLTDSGGLPKRLRVLEGPSRVEPMTWGIARPRVLVPAGWEQWPPDVAAAVLAHEIAHVRRLDIARQLPWELARTLFWFNPIVPFAARQARLAHEQACDDEVVRRGVAPTSLADALLALARELRARRASRVSVASGGGTELATRIAALVDTSRVRRPASAASAAAAVFLACLTLISATISFAVEPAVGGAGGSSGECCVDERGPTIVGAVGRALDSAFVVLADRGLSGTVLVATDTDVLFAKGFGFADRSRRIPAAVDTRYHVAGITKAFTAAAVADLIDRGVISADARLGQYLPEVGATAGRITVHELLTHTDGLGDVLPGPTAATSADFLTSLGTATSSFAPGASYGSADVGHSVLAALVERVTTRSFEAHVRERLLRPAAMASSFFRFETDAPRVAVAVGYTAAGAPVEPAADGWGVRGSRGLVTTVHDLRRWYDALTKGRLVRQGALDLMFSPYVRTQKPFDQGYGWLLYDERTAPPFRGGPIPVRRRSGREAGFEAEMLHDPNGGWIAIVLLNADDGRRLAAVETIRAVMDAHPPPQR